MKKPLSRRGFGRLWALIHAELLLVEGIDSITHGYPLGALGCNRRLGRWVESNRGDDGWLGLLDHGADRFSL